MALAKRIIPLLLNRGGTLVKGRGFNHGRIVGHALQAVRVYQARDVDELIFLDIEATNKGVGPDVGLVKQLTNDLFSPLTVGGGVSNLDHIRQLLANGADKVSINSAAVWQPGLVNEAATRFGSQAIVISIDVKNGYVHTDCGKVDTGLDPKAFAIDMQARGAGEILLNSIERDGTLSGYDLDLINDVSNCVSIPVVACGGAGSYEDLRLALEAGAHAVAASALWHFTDNTPAGAADYLAAHGIPVRRRVAA